MSTTEEIPIRLNGEPRRVSAASLPALLAELGVDPERRGVAVALNGAVVPRAAWAATRVGADDELEVIGAVQGG